MANTIITKNSSTASAVPTAGDLVQGELAVNVTDKRLFTEDAGGNIVEIGTNPSTINIDAGTIDGTAIGGTTPTTGAFTTLTANTSLTAATADINGGTIDGTAIGGTTPAAGAFTTLSASGAVTLSGGTANGVPYLNGSKVLTSGSALTFDGTNLGVGVASPAAPLHIASAASGGKAIRLNGRSADGNSDIQFFDNTGATQYGDIGAYASAMYLQTSTNIPIIFYQNGSEAMRLTSTGLGIGTSSPSEKLHVNSGAGNVPALFESTDALAVVQFKDNNSTLFNAVGVQTNALIFYSGDSINMRLDSSGNLGLGVTPSAGTSGKVFQITNAGHFMASGSIVYIDANAYFDSGWKYITSAAASNYYQSSGSHIWNTAPSGTAGNAISFTQAMTLDASGKLGIGTSSPGDKIELGGNGSGIIIRSPNGTRYRLTVTDVGILSIAAA